jgi:hypothetical protein
VKPVVKITGEFWAQLTEGDGNFNMFAFLEREGAHVVVDSVGNWVMYLMHQASAQVSSIRFAASARLAGSHFDKNSVAASFHCFAISSSSCFIVLSPVEVWGRGKKV